MPGVQFLLDPRDETRIICSEICTLHKHTAVTSRGAGGAAHSGVIFTPELSLGKRIMELQPAKNSVPAKTVGEALFAPESLGFVTQIPPKRR